MHSLLLASSCGFARVWRPRGAARTCPQARPLRPTPGTPSSRSSPLCLRLRSSSISLPPAAGQSITFVMLNMHFMHTRALHAQYVYVSNCQSCCSVLGCVSIGYPIHLDVLFVIENPWTSSCKAVRALKNPFVLSLKIFGLFQMAFYQQSFSDATHQ